MKLNAVVIFLLIWGSMMSVTGNAAETRREAEKTAVEKVIHNSICWALTKDRKLQESTMAHDEDLFIYWTNSNMAIAGWTRYLKLFDTWMDPRFKATVTEIRDLRIQISRSGDVAWFSALLDDLGEWDGKPIGARDIRWTGVLEKRKGKWVFVQMHGSQAADTVLAGKDSDPK